MKKKGVCVFTLIFCLLNLNLYAARYYVKKDGDDLTSGTTWETAFATLTKAADIATSGSEVWVAKGTYQEGAEITIPEGVSFFGGFFGTETSLDQRNITLNYSIIDGEAAYRCVINYGNIDGFHVTKGDPKGIDNKRGIVRNCTVYQNTRGVGIYNTSGWITNCTVFDNQSGISNNLGTVTNCIVFRNGSASKPNEGIYINQGEVINCIIYQNYDIGISGMYGTITNCISWKNRKGDITSDDSLVQNSCFGEATNDHGNFSANPLFTNTSGDLSTWDFHLKNGSPCIDAGTTNTAEFPDTDMDGNPRPGEDGKVCIGAHESPDEYLPGEPAPPKRLYIKTDGSDEDNGTSWSEALQTITKAISLSFQDEYYYDIWVAEGTYQEGENIYIPSTVSIFGGFDGSEMEFEERDFSSHQAIIDGMKKDYRNVENHGVIDGFHITGGIYYRGGGIYNYGIAANSTVYDNQSNYGGGIYNLGETINCIVHDNLGKETGGGIYNEKGKIINCMIFNNQSRNGGGVYNYGEVTNCLIYNNLVTSYGGGISNNGMVTNCTIYRNKANSGGGIYCYNGEAVNCISWKNDPDDINFGETMVKNCCFGGASNDHDNFSEIPLFASTSGDFSKWDFHLQNGSPCIDSGTINTVQLPETDLDGNPRPGGDGKVCMGAYESPDEYLPSKPAPFKRLHVKTDGNDDKNGTSWDQALKTIKKAISLTFTDDALNEIWVAEGTYQEWETIYIPRVVNLYGGFSGTETLIEERDWANNKTIIDGNNAYQCVRNYGVIDGFHVTKGKTSIYSGAGIANYSGTIENCIVYDNTLIGEYGGRGAGIFNSQGKVLISTVYANKSNAYQYNHGCGIYNYKGVVDGCIIYGNDMQGMGGGIFNNSGLVVNSTIKWNEANEGGGIYNANYSTVTECKIYQNSSSSHEGGGIHNDSSSTVTLCSIYGNESIYGGGIYNAGIVSNSDIYENIPNGEYSSGIGIYNTGGTVSNCSIHDNVIYEGLINIIKGEGIFNEDGNITDCHIYNNDGWGICNNAGLTINCSVYGNKKGGIYTNGLVSNCLVYGNLVSGIYNYSSGSITNCIAYGNITEANNAGIFTKDTGTVTNSIAWKNQSGDIIGGMIQYCSYNEAMNENGNISGNPFFINTSGDISTWDFHLTDGSPCIDAGTTDTVYMPEWDKEGNPRPGGDGKVCMGAYESPDEFHAWRIPVPLIRFYVKSDGSDEANGLSWDTALKTIKKAADLSLGDEANHYEIWVAEGLYQEGIEIAIPDYLSLYGGFSGTEMDIDQQNIIVHQTIIDGENTHRCVMNYGIINGFSITQGSSEKGGGIHNSGIVTNCRIYMNTVSGTMYPSGGGIYNMGEVTDCILNGNHSKHGGGIYNTNNGMTTRCIFYDNHADLRGGGVYSYKGWVTNCIFYENHAELNGGAIYNQIESFVSNCTLYRNSANLGGGILNHYTLVAKNCISWKNRGGDIIGGTIQNCCYGEAKGENGNFSANPLFENISGDMSTWDFQLKEGSPCIDSGRIEGAPLIDLEGNPRPGGDGMVCMGAYESPDEYLPGEPSTYSKRLYVKPDGSDDGTGASWDEALQTIEAAAALSFQDEFMYEIWAAKGTYMEGRTIQVPGAVYLYGGFTGTEMEVEQRDWKTFPTIIDGNNTHRCVENFGVIDGFHVTRGNGNGDYGDGIYNYKSVTNCMVYGNGNNENYSHGAGIYNLQGNITHCSVYLNNTAGYGGGISNSGDVRHCIIYGNNSSNGGGVYNGKGELSNCMIFGNNSGGDGGGVYNRSIINHCLVYGNSISDKSSIGGGVYNDYPGILTNSTIFGNYAENWGGVNTDDGMISNSIIWNNSYYNPYGINEEGIFYSCFQGITETNGNISADPMFINALGDMLLWDFHLKEDSPCIDAGDPNTEYNDGCLPPGKGAERNDMGAYGGPENCEFPEIIPPKAVLGVLTEYGDAWGAQNQGSPPFEQPYRRGWLGFRFSPSEGWYVLKEDADQLGLDDLIQITEYGDAWVSKSYDFINSEPTRWGWLGFKYDERDGYQGWLPLAGDVNGDEACDLIQVTHYGDAWVALSKRYAFASPTRWGWLGYRFNRAQTGENGALPLSGDANGDGLDDLIQVTEYTDVWVSLSTGSSYDPPTRWGWLGFKYAPYDGWYPLCGDVNADGRDDLVQITPTGDPWVALSLGDSYTSPSRWGWIGFYYNEELGYYPLLEDVNADGRKDLIQITPEGEAWIAPALDGTFDVPEYWGKPGFIFSREKKYLPFFLDN